MVVTQWTKRGWRVDVLLPRNHLIDPCYVLSRSVYFIQSLFGYSGNNISAQTTWFALYMSEFSSQSFFIRSHPFSSYHLHHSSCSLPHLITNSTLVYKAFFSFSTLSSLTLTPFGVSMYISSFNGEFKNALFTSACSILSPFSVQKWVTFETLWVSQLEQRLSCNLCLLFDWILVHTIGPFSPVLYHHCSFLFWLSIHI